MFGIRRPSADISWKSFEDDFILGACSRRIFGFAHRGADGEWSAFDDDARILGAYPDLDAVKAVLWHMHRETHDTSCATAPMPRTGRPAGIDESRPHRVAVFEPPARGDVSPGSW